MSQDTNEKLFNDRALLISTIELLLKLLEEICVPYARSPKEKVQKAIATCRKVLEVVK